MNILIMGPPGAGKGTQAAKVVEKHGLCHLATGDILRREIREGSDLGKRAKEYVESGKLVPDKIIIEMMTAEMLKATDGAGVLLDGFPRTLSQAESLDKALDDNGLKLDAVINIRVPHDVLLDRLLQRLTCENCKQIFHKTARPPKTDGVCDACGGKLVARSDDNSGVIEERLKVYHAETEPVINHYEKLNVLSDIDGNREIDDIAANIINILGNLD